MVRSPKKRRSAIPNGTSQQSHVASRCETTERPDVQVSVWCRNSKNPVDGKVKTFFFGGGGEDAYTPTSNSERLAAYGGTTDQARKMFPPVLESIHPLTFAASRGGASNPRVSPPLPHSSAPSATPSPPPLPPPPLVPPSSSSSWSGICSGREAWRSRWLTASQ